MGESEGSPCIRAVDIYYETGFWIRGLGLIYCFKLIFLAFIAYIVFYSWDIILECWITGMSGLSCGLIL
jgi:TRAP-type mannitol/chloroaromatic compound transport system permease small subunit